MNLVFSGDSRPHRRGTDPVDRKAGQACFGCWDWFVPRPPNFRLGIYGFRARTHLRVDLVVTWLAFRRHSPSHLASTDMRGVWSSGWRENWPGSCRSRRGCRDLPGALTVDDAVRIAEAITASHAESSPQRLRRRLEPMGALVRGPRHHGVACRPSNDLRLPHPTRRRGRLGRHPRLACGAIAYRHKMHGLDDPVLSEGVLQVRRGLRRIVGTAPRRQARPSAWPRSARSSPP